jgi:hypothetical protein
MVIGCGGVGLTGDLSTSLRSVQNRLHAGPRTAGPSTSLRSGRDDNSVVTTFFIPLGGPKAHDYFGRDDNSVVSGEGCGGVGSTADLSTSLRSVQNRLHAGPELQISPLRFAPVETTILW